MRTCRTNCLLSYRVDLLAALCLFRNSTKYVEVIEPVVTSKKNKASINFCFVCFNFETRATQVTVSSTFVDEYDKFFVRKTAVYLTIFVFCNNLHSLFTLTSRIILFPFSNFLQEMNLRIVQKFRTRLLVT